MADQGEEPKVLPPEVRATATELVWRCSNCGSLHPRSHWPPQQCPGSLRLGVGAYNRLR